MCAPERRTSQLMCVERRHESRVEPFTIARPYNYIVNISDQSKSLGFTSNIYGDPRTFGVSLRYAFGS